jgi:hypothetical protein
MLYGKNELHLNEVSMVTIIQYYLDNKLLNKDNHSPKVEAVRVKDMNAGIFIVSLQGEKDSSS